MAAVLRPRDDLLEQLSIESRVVNVSAITAGLKKLCGHCSGSRMHLSRAIVPAEKLRLFSRKTKIKEVTHVGFRPRPIMPA